MNILHKRLSSLAMIALFACSSYGADATGTWTISTQGRGGGGGGGQPAQATLKLGTKNGKMVGTVTTPGRQGAQTEVQVSDLKVTGNDIVFMVEREFGGNKVVQKYSAKLDENTLVGAIEGPGRDGATVKRDWSAKKISSRDPFEPEIPDPRNPKRKT